MAVCHPRCIAPPPSDPRGPGLWFGPKSITARKPRPEHPAPGSWAAWSAALPCAQGCPAPGGGVGVGGWPGREWPWACFLRTPGSPCRWRTPCERATFFHFLRFPDFYLFPIKIFTVMNSKIFLKSPVLPPHYVFTSLVSLKMSGSVLFMKGKINIIKI